MRTAFRTSLVAIGLWAVAAPLHSYPVAESLPLDKLVEEADAVFKGTVLSSEPIDAEPFKPIPGFAAFATTIRVVSSIKGDTPAGEVVFQHYGTGEADSPRSPGYAPQYYDLERGRPYIVFAKKTDQPAVYRQIWQDHRMKADQGVVLAANDRPIADGRSPKEIIGKELESLLKSRSQEDIVYAIRQLDEMSGGGFGAVEDFDRAWAMDKIHPLFGHRDDAIVRAALATFNLKSPLMDEGNAPHWLLAMGKGILPGLSVWDAPQRNAIAARYWRELAALVDGTGAVDLRAMAVKALGLAGEPALREHVVRWSQAQEPPIRQAAVMLLFDFPGEETSHLLAERARDPAFEVRSGVARAVGFGQFRDLIPLLDGLLGDGNEEVRTAAALSLLSFETSEVAQCLERHINDPDFKSVFVNALARVNPEPYIESLAEVVEQRSEPKRFWGGRIPHADSWDILFAYVQRLPPVELQSSEITRALDALDRAQFYGSSEPRDLYAFYLKRHLPQRAADFRRHCRESVSFDMEYFFKTVDGTPGGSTPE